MCRTGMGLAMRAGMMRAVRSLALASITAFLLACEGATGPTGPTGPGGPGGPPGDPAVDKGTLSGTVTDAETGLAIAAASITLTPGSLAATADGSGAFELTGVPIGSYRVSVVATGYTGTEVTGVSIAAGLTTSVDVELTVPVVTTGAVAGTVARRAPAGAPDAAVAGATVALVDAVALAASASDWPLEELAAASPYQAVTGATGAYAISGVAPGRYYVHAMPAAGDLVLPGGDASRESFLVAADAEKIVNITLSQRASDAATYLGSATCLLCHSPGGPAAYDASGWKHTLHALIHRVPDQATSLQDMSRLPNHDRAHQFFKDGNPRDNTGAGDGLGLRIGKPAFSAFPAGYNLLIGFDTRYFVQFETPGGVRSLKYYADFTFGGHGIYKERWVTRVAPDGTYDPTPGGDSSYYILPLQFDENLQPGVEPFHPYNPANWGPPTVSGGPAVKPAFNKSFDNNCAGCHFTGTTLARDANAGFHAAGADVQIGTMDYDGDGNLDEMDIGCEQCHGPGSEHLNPMPSAGKRIVMPSLLSAERSSMICGRCHTRGVGKGAIGGDHTEFPSAGDGAVALPPAGVSLADFRAIYHDDAPGNYADDGKHARQHHQQFLDHTRSMHYKNPYQLLSCESCHDSHDRAVGQGPSLSARVDDNALCLGCHSYFPFELGTPAGGTWTMEQEAESVAAHMSLYADMTVGYDPTDKAGTGTAAGAGGVGRCTGCHMPKTAASQSRFWHEQVDASGQPAGPRIRGDVSSHQMDIVTPAASQTLFNTAASNKQLPNSCGSCHNTILGIEPNYTY